MTTERTFTAARKAQGYLSQAQLDAFYTHYDHVTACAACHAKNGGVELSDGWQPTQGQCPEAVALETAYFGFSGAK